MIFSETLPENGFLSPLVKRLRLARTFFSGAPMWCSWQVTYRCMFRCEFCGYYRTPPGGYETTLDQFTHGSRNLAEVGSLMVNLAGGEPMLREDIVDVVREVSRYHLTFLTTNGWQVTPGNARALFEAGLWGASVSLDYVDAERHDARRGRKGAFERAVHALKCFNEARTQSHQRVNIQAVLFEDNLDQIGPLAELAAAHRANFMVQPYCVLKTGDRRFVARHDVSRTLLRLKAEHRNFLSNPLFLEKFDYALNGGVPGCRCGLSFFNIDQFGHVAKCVEDRGHPVGSIFNDNLDVLMARLRRRNRLNTCQRCWYNCRGEIESIYVLRGMLHSLPTYFYGLAGPRRAE